MTTPTSIPLAAPCGSSPSFKTRLLGALCAPFLLASAWAQTGPGIRTNTPADLVVSRGASARFFVTLTNGIPPYSFQWRHEQTELDGATNSILNLTNVQAGEAGGYSVVVTDATGPATSRVAQLTVDPTFIRVLQGPGKDMQVAAGASWADYDGDGFLDLFIANFAGGARNALYHNNGDGTFTRITTNAIATDVGEFFCGVWTDFDNDGDPDLHAVRNGTASDLFYRNDGQGVFTRLQPAFTRDISDDITVTWWDYDQDGWLDVFIPRQGGNDRLYRGFPDSSFRSMTAPEVADAVTGSSPYGWAKPVDYDNDGWQDLLVAPMSFTTSLTYRLLHNDGSGMFRNITEGPLANQRVHIAYTVEANWGDYDNDGDFDVMVLTGTNVFSGRLFQNQGGGVFEDVAPAAGVNRPLNAWYSIWGDYDNDGDLDMFVSCSDMYYPDRPKQGNDNVLFRNNGDGTFTSIDVGSPIHDGNRDMEPSWADYDNDGFLDLFISAGNGLSETNYLYRNNLNAAGNTNHWLKVKLQGQASNRAGVGAKVRVKATIRGQAVWQLRQIEAPGTPDTQNQGFLAHFGLGDATKVDTLRIEWPSGIVQELRDVAADQTPYLTVLETQNLPLPPPEITASGRAADGTFQAAATYATLNVLCVLEASTNLVQWAKLSVRTNTTGTVQFDDPGATNRPARFYRVVVP
jgi:hypothetical protein